MPEITLKTFVIASHLMGLCIGLGGAIIMDAIIFKFFHHQKITQDQVSLFTFMSKLVTAGLVILWLTGLGFLAIYYFQDAAKLANPKIWGKVSIVTILTLNGVFLHYKILPLVKAFVGNTLFAISTPKQNLLMVATGTVSAVSWFIPFFLGVAKEFNFSVSIAEILAVYAVTLMLVGSIAALIMKQLVHSNKIPKQLPLSLSQQP